jgi:polysaccharide biosynthesis transport protein
MHLPLRELGVIPSVRGRGLRLMPLRGASGPVFDMSVAAGNGALTPAARSSAMSAYLQNPGVCEAFFATMNSLLFACRERSSGRVIVLTSPEARDGKTTVATNLAIALSQIGRRVVLVDGDLRKPRLHAMFDEDPENGLAKLLEDTGEVSAEVLRDFIRPTRVENLFIIPTRPVGEGLSRKLHSPRLRSVIDRLRREFDIVLIDSPPVLHISDARVFGALADGVLLVFRARKTTRESAMAVYDCLIQDGVRILGTILNDWNPRKGSRYAAYSSYFRAAS